MPDPIPDWLPRAPPMTPAEVESLTDPATAVFVVVAISFWFAWQYMVEVSGWMDAQ